MNTNNLTTIMETNIMKRTSLIMLMAFLILLLSVPLYAHAPDGVPDQAIQDPNVRLEDQSNILYEIEANSDNPNIIVRSNGRKQTIDSHGDCIEDIPGTEPITETPPLFKIKPVVDGNNVYIFVYDYNGGDYFNIKDIEIFKALETPVFSYVYKPSHAKFWHNHSLENEGFINLYNRYQSEISLPSLNRVVGFFSIQKSLHGWQEIKTKDTIKIKSIQ